MSLIKYNKKRNFKQTNEPKGKVSEKSKLRFVVQRHQASHLHYDFRLEIDGVLKSWAVPKGPSLNPAQKRLAVMVEDHPVSYIDFEGDIPKGNYGAGSVQIWDHGSFIPVNKEHEKISESAALKNLKNGELKFILKGKKLKGEFVLVRLHNDDKNWLLIKHKDEYAVNKNDDAEKTTKENTKKIASIRHGRAKKIKNYIKPMLAKVSKEPFDDANWIFEIKWDGYRAISELKEKNIKFYSRNGVDFSQRFPVIFNALQKLSLPCTIDGEVVLLNSNGMPDFQKLQNYENNLDLPLIYYVFDILELNGKNLVELPLLERKKILKKLLGKNKLIHYCDHLQKSGISFLTQAKEKGLEGIMAKEISSTYKPGFRSSQWLKIKNVQSTEVVIVGYTKPKGNRSYFGSLVLATASGKGWLYRGHAGTGFTEIGLKQLMEKMKPLKNDTSPFNKEVPVNGDVTWLRPKLVADIAYTEITKDKIFRHPVFLRLRDDKTTSSLNEEVVDDVGSSHKNKKLRIGTHQVPITNSQKIFWPEEGYTKAEVIDFYNNISSYILPYLKNRPLSLKRNPNGIRDEGFYHKDAGENVPSFVKVYKLHSESSNKTIDYIVCNNKATLIYLANLGCIEINPWNSTLLHPAKPTWMVIDIDPSPKNSFKQVVDAALATKEILDQAGLTNYCKTSGASGLHVYVPLKNRYDYTTVKDFAHMVAALVTEKLPSFTTLERSLNKRGNNIYIDYLQNRNGQTLAAPYSLRPVAGASVSTPLHWKEVNHKLDPLTFNIKNIMTRLKKTGDIFKDVLNRSNNLNKALKNLSGK